MAYELTLEERDAFLQESVVATLATYRRDGSILLSPVWYEWRDGGFNVAVGHGDVKLRHVARDARASIAVADGAPPYRGVEARGTARIVEDGYAEAQRRMAARYLADVEPYNGSVPASLATEGVVLRLEPDSLRS
jgi:PPOX class probable F420-dependent enzyme